MQNEAAVIAFSFLTAALAGPFAAVITFMPPPVTFFWIAVRRLSVVSLSGASLVLGVAVAFSEISLTPKITAGFGALFALFALMREYRWAFGRHRVGTDDSLIDKSEFEGPALFSKDDSDREGLGY